MAAAAPAGAAPVVLAPPGPALDLLLDADGQYDGAQAGEEIGTNLDVASVTSAGSTVDAIIGHLGSGGVWARVVRGTPPGQVDLAQAVSGLRLTSAPGGIAEATSVGDLDGDGLDEVLLWGYPNQPARIFAGRPAQDPTLTSTSPGVLSVRAPGRFLSSISGVGDVDGDGLDDLATLTSGAAGRDRVDVVRSVAGRTALDIGAPDAVGFQITLRNGAQRIGPAGDLNGDGRGDIVVQTSDRRMVVVYGSSTTLPIAASALGQAGFEIAYPDDGSAYGPFFDAVAVPAGDVNRDGLDDLAIGARMFINGSTTGSVVVIYGRRDATGTVDVSALGSRGVRIDGPTVAGASYFGDAVAAGADLVGGPAPDLVIGAPLVSEGGREGQGAVYVVSVEGERGSFSVDERGWTGYRIDGPTRNAEIGDTEAFTERRLAVGGVGGNARLLIGVPSADPRNRRDAGSVFVVKGELGARPVAPLLRDVAYVPYAAASRTAVRAPCARRVPAPPRAARGSRAGGAAPPRARPPGRPALRRRHEAGCGALHGGRRRAHRVAPRRRRQAGRDPARRRGPAPAEGHVRAARARDRRDGPHVRAVAPALPGALSVPTASRASVRAHPSHPEEPIR